MESQPSPHKYDSENIIEIEIPYPLFQYLSSEECNLQNICRICLSVNNSVLYPLFSAKDQCVLANMFMAISEVQMSPEDGLPSNVCPECQREVMNYYEFKMKCVKSDYTLKSVLKGEFVTNSKCDTNNDALQLNIKSETDSQQIMKDNNNVPAMLPTKKHEDTDYLEDTKYYMSNEGPHCTMDYTFNNIQRGAQCKIKSEENNSEMDMYNNDTLTMEENTGADFLEDIKDSMSDDEALCIVQDTANNQKEITIIDSDPKTLFETTKEIKENIVGIKKGKHQCTFCSKKFHKAKSLKEHMSKVHVAAASQYPYPCDSCKEAFDSESDLKIHGMLHNQGAAWKCAQCHKEFKGRTALRRHIERHMSRRRFACARCGAAFVERYALRRHARVHTGQPAEKNYHCTHCDKRFGWAGALRAHMSAHGAARGCVCADCGRAFASARLLASHRRVHSADKPYACSYCDKRFRHESTRNTHVRTHTGERPYVCARCGKAFIQHSNMTLHMRTHTGERPYSCSMCVRTFSSSSTLKAHVRSHTGERPYSCDVCGKRFARVSLKNHMRLHSDERPFACPAPACHKRFNSQHRLRDHCRVHTGETPYECANCNDKFMTKYQLMRHVKKHETKVKMGKKGAVMLMPVTVSDKNVHLASEEHIEHSDQCIYVGINEEIPSTQADLCSPKTLSESLAYDNEEDVKTEVIVLDSNPNLVANSVSYVNDVNLVTVNEGEVSISAASASVDGTTVKLYQYDQSLLQIHTGSGQLTISRISSKMTANF